MVRREAGQIPVRKKAKRFWPYALTGALVGMLLALVWQFPAVWVSMAVSRASAGRVQLLEASGSLWNGSAVLGVAGGAGSHDARVLPGRLSWKLRPQWWHGTWMPALRLELEQPCCMPETDTAWLLLQPGWESLRFELYDLHYAVPASFLQGLGTPWNTLGLDGTLRVSVDRWSGWWSHGRLEQQGRAVVRMQTMASRLSTVRPLGSYRLEWEAGGAAASDQLAFELVTEQGPLQLHGTGTWQAGGRWRMSIEAGAEPLYRQALASLLSLIGNRNGGVAVRIR